MYARRVDDRELHFSVSGMLWEGSLVMVDEETETLWSHILGEAMRGPLTGEKLDVIPAIMTDWKTWKSRQPNTTVAVMNRTADRYRRGIIADGAAYGICYATPMDAKCWPLPLLHDKPKDPFSAARSLAKAAINDKLDEQPLVVYWESESETAVIYDRRIDEETLTFEIVEGKLQDQETKTIWDPILGMGLEGPHKGRRLRAVPAFISEMSVWALYHPNTRVWNGRGLEAR